MRTLRLPSGPVTLVDEGEGPVVVALHGAPGGHRDFRHLAPLLAPHVRVIRPDLPGFGGTAVGDRSIDGRAAWVRELLDGVGVDRATFLGHSMGGIVATALAVQFPERVAGLALVSTPGPRKHRGMRAMRGLEGVFSALMATPLRGPLTGPMRRGYAALGFSRSLTDAERLEGVHLAGATSLRAHADNLRRLAVPTLVAFAEDDRLIEPEIFRELCAVVPPGPRLSFPDGGHNLQKTQAIAIAEALLRWIGVRL